MINEICPANADVNYDPKYFNFSGWVELYNKGNSSVNIGGYYLSDKPDRPEKWRIPTGTTIPANGFMLIWCDEQNQNLHTNFSLDSEGESVILSTSTLSKVDQIDFPEQYTNIAYGRTTDGGSTWSFLLNPTPAKKNDGTTATQRIQKPTISLASGRYSASQSVSLSHPLANVKIRYTTDGSEPHADSKVYSGPFSISKTATVKAKAFLAGFIPSDTEVETYFINEHAFTLPVVSISTKSTYLWDNTIGIYADGTNGIAGNCQNAPRNWNRDWDRHAVFEMFDTNGERRFSQAVDIRIGGACSRNNPQKSFVVKARDKYGSNTIDEKLFSSKENASYGGFIYRNSGNDFYYTMFRDALMQTLTIGQMDIDYLAYEPTIFYLNGEYWGVQNLREKIDADYFESNYGIDKDDLDLGEREEALEGSVSGYTNYLSTLQNMDLTTPQAFDYIDDNIDVQEYINYLVAEIYYCNTDWPGNNVKYWRQRSTNGKWRWILWDMDFGFALYNDQSYATHPTLQFATATNAPTWPNPPWSTLHIRLLLKNPEFRNRFIQTFTTALSTTFHPDRVIDVINSFQNRIKNEMPYHHQRWQLNLSNWNQQVQRLREFATQRNAYMYYHLATFFGLTDQVNITLSSTPANAGGIAFNGIQPDATLTDGVYFQGLPYTAEAVAETGYQFSHWNIRTSETTAVPLIEKQSNWKYFDSGTLPAADWTSESFDDNAWAEGQGELGYGDGGEQTIVGYGGNAAAKFITTYFRKTISVDDPTNFSILSGSVLFDDGIVIYLNGAEVFRSNMPSGAIGNNTPALDASPEDVYVPFTIPKGAIKAGENVLAVEIHQINGESSDISFDLELKTVEIGDETEFSSTEVSIRDIANTSIMMEAVFEPVTPQGPVVINEFAAANNTIEDEDEETEDWIELFNPGTQPVDIAGFFITDNLNNKTKYQIKAGQNNETVIQPGEYKILWADEELHEGPLHINFKLSADGESIGLYQKVGSTLLTVDEITYAAHYNGTSYSRIPNATGPFLLTSKLTPLAENELEIPTAREDGLEASVVLHPNPTSTDVVITSPFPVEDVSFYTVTGKRLDSYAHLSSGAQVSLSHYPAGVYFVIISVRGKAITKRIVKM